MDQYAAVPGSLITILQKTQDALGFLSEDSVMYIAERTGIPVSQIYGVATFYAQFRLKPIGKYLLLVCMGTACHVNGASGIVDTITEKLGIADGETTADGLFTLNIVACLGCCSLAPVMMVREKDSEEVYGNLTRARLAKVLDEIAAGSAGSANTKEVSA
jgi:NADH-quinone oxidoreductase subunit E